MHRDAFRFCLSPHLHLREALFLLDTNKYLYRKEAEALRITIASQTARQTRPDSHQKYSNSTHATLNLFNSKLVQGRKHIRDSIRGPEALALPPLHENGANTILPDDRLPDSLHPDELRLELDRAI